MSLETDLRAALQERAAPITASSRLRGVDYGVRTRRIRPFIALGGGLASSVTAIAAVLLLAGGTSNAFAGWTRTPTAATAAQLASANAYCAAHMPTPGLPIKLTDERGTFTFEVYANATAADFCITGPSFINASGFSSSAPLNVPPGRLSVWSEHTDTYQGSPYGFIIASAATDVSAATFTLDNGSQVTATVQNGWAVAWWPGTNQVTSAQLTTPTGTQTQTFAPNTCAPTNYCTGPVGGPHGGTTNGGPGGG